jgi:hypothetical protein
LVGIKDTNDLPNGAAFVIPCRCSNFFLNGFKSLFCSFLRLLVGRFEGNLLLLGGMPGRCFDALTRLFPCNHLHAHHGAACSGHGMSKLIRWPGRLALASVPHHNGSCGIGGREGRSCRKPFAQPRDSTTREEQTAFGYTKTNGEGRKKRVCLEYQNGFYEH